MTRLYHQFLEFLAERRVNELKPRGFTRDNTVRDAQGNPYGSSEYNMQPKPRVKITNEEREEHISPEDREARKEAEKQHTEKVMEIKNSFQNARKRYDLDTGPDDSRNMKHDIVFHDNGKVHIRTDLNTGRTEVTHEKDTLAQKKARHLAEVEKEREGMGPHVIDHKHYGNSFETTITPLNKDGTPNYRKEKVVTTDHVTGETEVI